LFNATPLSYTFELLSHNVVLITLHRFRSASGFKSASIAQIGIRWRHYL